MKTTNPEEVLDALFVDEYKKILNTIYPQLVSLNTNLFLIEHIESFRFDLFQPFHSPFWPTIKVALLEASLMIIWRITVDPDKRTLTITTLKGLMDKNWLPTKIKEHDQFVSELKQAEFEAGVSDIQKRVQIIRQNHLAHFNLDWNANPEPRQILNVAIRLQDLKNYLAKVEKFS